MGLKIQQLIKNQLGEWVTCSIGIADNKLIAKLASDIDKPNGLVLVNNENKEKILLETKLTDFCGLGRRLEQRLDNLGIDSVLKLREYPEKYLIQEFGPHAGNFLHNMAYGINFDPVIPYYEEAEVKSVSRSYTLPHDCYDKEEVFSVLLHLCEKAGRELRSKKLAGKIVVVYLRYADFAHAGFRQTLPGHINDSLKLFDICHNRLDKFRLPKAVRLVGIYITNLVKDYKQLPLWEKDRKLEKLLPSLDKINDLYGELTIKPAYLLKLKRLKNRVGGFKIQM